ncbi:MAG: hypothetical protein IKK79_03255 [Spirochaetaceae bacterium]|nr:hypothetical protein [Spirochaetaceae bacterium]
MDAGKLIINDECGATPLIRALQEYKCCQLNYSHQYRQKRGKIFSSGTINRKKSTHISVKIQLLARQWEKNDVS